MDIKLAVQKTNVNKFMNFCDVVRNTAEHQKTKGYIESKSRMIIEMWNKLDATHDNILLEVTDNEKQGSVYFSKSEFDKAFSCYDEIMLHLQTTMEKVIKPIVPTIPPIQLPQNLTLTTGDKSKLKLKPVDIPTFSGDYKKWLSFRSLFDSMVHNNNKVEELEKMHYLKSCLSGDAESLISQFEAYTVITDRFHNEVILVDAHIMDLLLQPTLTSESSDAIKKLMDVTASNLRALKTLKIDTTSWDPILLLLLVQKLDKSTKRLWEQTLKPKIRPTIKEFLEFLATRFHALGVQQNFSFSIESSSNVNHQNNKKNFSSENRFHGSYSYNSHSNERSFPPRVHQSFHNSSRRACPICSNENHSIFSCPKFREADPRIRIEMVDRIKLCQRCIKNHQSECNQIEACRACGGNHHTFLHIVNQQSTQSQVPPSSDITQPGVKDQPTSVINSHHISLRRSQPTSTSIINTHHVNISEDRKLRKNNQLDRHVTPWDATVLLATALILIRPLKTKIFLPFRSLLDQGGEASHISESVVQKLGLTKTKISASMCGLGGVKVGSSNSFVEFEIGSRINQDFIMNVQAVVVPKVTNPLPSSFIAKSNWKHLEGLRLADPEFSKPDDIDVILGSAIYGYLLLPGLKKASRNCPVAQNTELGWILSGATEPDPTSNVSTNHQETKIDKKIEEKINNRNATIIQI